MKAKIDADKLSQSHAPLTADHLLQAERQYLGKSDQPLTAVALSGGGIRSASFGLGVLQALVSAQVLNKFDYMSSASGGGYLASSLTWFLHQGLPDGRPAGTEPDNFPFGERGKGCRTPHESPSQHRSNMLLDYLRQHGRYLTPGQGIDGLSLIGFALRNMGVSLALHLGLFLSLILALQFLGAFQPIELMQVWPVVNQLVLMAALALGVFGLSSLLFALSTAVPGYLWGLRYPFRLNSQYHLGLLLQAMAVLVTLGTLPIVHQWLAQHVFQHPIHMASLTTVAGMLVSAVQRKAKLNTKLATGLAFVASALVLYGLLLGAYALFGEAVRQQLLPELYGLTAVLLVLSWVINSNYFSLHRMYRDRLMEAFMPDPDKVMANAWGKATLADRGQLKDMCAASSKADRGQLKDTCAASKNPRPYHLINTNVVLVNSNTARYQSRGGDSFVLSPLYCGSDATGYIATRNWKVNADMGMSLATAMATSGASFNPNSGNSGRGLSRSPLVSVLLTVLNLRLGQWVSNPGRQGLFWQRPNFLTTGLFAGWFGTRHDESSRMLELTDGGHFDNMALYELIRRKLSLILLSDAGADPSFCFDDLGNAVERVRVDFGVKIRFDDPNFNLDTIQPGAGCDGLAFITERYGLSKHAFALGSIDYPDGQRGILIYIKAAMLSDLPVDIYSYKNANPSFPHEPTFDQFFDEVQFEAYRELAYQLTWTMLNQFGENNEQGRWQPFPNGPLALLC